MPFNEAVYCWVVAAQIGGTFCDSLNPFQVSIKLCVTYTSWIYVYFCVMRGPTPLNVMMQNIIAASSVCLLLLNEIIPRAFSVME